MTKRILLSLVALGLVSGPPLQAAAEQARQSRVIEDFEDVGSWRARENRGSRLGEWFSVGLAFGGSQQEQRGGDYVGELRYSVNPEALPPYRYSFERVKASLLEANADGIEIDVNTQGRQFNVRFVLIDAQRKRFTTPNIVASGEGWHHYRVELDPAQIKDGGQMRLPVHLERIVFETNDPREGSIFVDNIAFTGTFAQADVLAVRPVYEGLATEPGQPVVLRYRAENALAEDLQGTLSARVHDSDGKFLMEKSVGGKLAGGGFSEFTVELGQLPVGAYQVDVSLADAQGNYSASYDDMFGVFAPNNGRVNKRPMWMGVQDQAIWQSKGERELHMEWMVALGSDADRVGGGSGRLEPADGVWSVDNWRELLKPYESSGIDVLFTFFELPEWITRDPKRRRTPPRDMQRFAQHSAEFAEFTKEFPAIKWVQFWNEPDSGGPNVGHGFFHGTKDEFLSMFDTFTSSFRSVRDDVKLTTGGLTLGDEIAGVSHGSIVGHAGSYDVAAFHAHGSLENYETKQEKVEGWMREAGISKPILNSETGERSGYTRGGRFQQAITLVQKIAYAKSRPSSELYLWFTLQDYWDMDREADDSFGLITSDNRVKPSFIAYNELIRQLANTDPEPELQWGADVRVLPFRRDDGSLVYVCWLQNGSASDQVWLQVSQGAEVTRTDMYGLSEPLPQFGSSAFLALGKAPVYLTTGKSGAAAKLEAEAQPRDAFFTLPPAVTIDGEGEARLPLSFRQPQGQSATDLQVRLFDTDGKPVWEHSYRLKAGDTLQTEIPLSAGLLTQNEYRFVDVELRWGAGQGQSVRVPVWLELAYPIHRLAGIERLFSDDLSSVESLVLALPTIVLDQPDDVVEFAFDPSIRPWQGPQDLSVVARVAHDGKGLYLRFDVTDDKHVQISTPSRLDRGDSVAVAVGTSESGVTRFLMGLSDKGWTALWFNSAPDANSIGRYDLPLRVKRTGNVTRYETYIPFEQLGIDAADEDLSQIRFAFMVNEDDGQRPDRWQRRVRYLRWFSFASEIDRLGHGVLKQD